MNPDLPFDTEPHIALILIASLSFFILVWIGVMTLISFLGGWHRLSQKYSTNSFLLSTAESFHYQSLYLSYLGRYNSSITISLNQEGIVFEPIIFFRFLHPPILIPWSTIKNIKYRKVFFHGATLTLSDDQRITFWGKSVLALNKYAPQAHGRKRPPCKIAQS